MAFLIFVVSVIAAYVGYCQLKIANAKLRMDLYNKRFAIYTAALDLYQACWFAEYPGQKAAQNIFIRYFRESQFLFEGKDGVYKSLEKMKDGASKISFYNQKEYEGTDNVDRDNRAAHEMKLNGFTEIQQAIETLEIQLATYLNFSDVDGWNNKNLTMAGAHVKTSYEWVRVKLMGLFGKQG